MSNVEQSTQFASESFKANLQPNDAPTTPTTTTTTITNTTISTNSTIGASGSGDSTNPNNVTPNNTKHDNIGNNDKSNNGSNHNNIVPTITTASTTETTHTPTTTTTATISTNISTSTAISIPTTIANTTPLANSSVIPISTTNTSTTTTTTTPSSTTIAPPTATIIPTTETNNGTTSATTTTNASSTANVNHNNKGSRNKSKDNNNNSDNVETIASTNNGGNINPSADGTSLMQSQQPQPLFTSSQVMATAPSAAITSNTTTQGPKPKTTRNRKTANNNKDNTPPTPKPEPKRPRAKSAKATAVAAATTIENSATSAVSASGLNDKNTKSTQPMVETPPAAKKRKSRSTSHESNNPTVGHPPPPPVAPVPATPVASPAKSTPARRPRKKKGDPPSKPADKTINSLVSNNPASLPLNVANPQLLSVASNMPIGLGPNLNAHPHPHHQPQPQPHHHQHQHQHHHHQQPQQQQAPHVNTRLMPGISPLDNQDPSNRYFSLTISPYANYDYTNSASLTRPSLSRLFTSSSSSAADSNPGSAYSDELAKAFDELRENTWSQLSKCILEEAQQFDIPSLLGTLYTLRDENSKLKNKVKDLTMKKDQLLNINARLELPGPALMNHLNATSPNYSSIMSRLTISPKNLPNSSPSPATKSPFSGSSYNHVPPGGLLGPPSFLDRSSPLVSVQTPHSGVNSLKSSSISTPSPPIGALMAHGVNNRAGLMTVGNPSYMSNVHPSINTSNPLGPNPPSSSYYPRQ